MTSVVCQLVAGTDLLEITSGNLPEMLFKPFLSGLGPRRSAWCRIRISAPRALRILYCWTFGRDFRPIAPLAHFRKQPLVTRDVHHRSFR